MKPQIPKASPYWLPALLGIIFIIVWTIGVMAFVNWRNARIFRSPIVFQSPILVREDIEEKESVEVEEQIEPTPITLRMSSYWPPLGGANCGQFIGGVCLSKMASGLAWQDWEGVGMACPEELEFGTKIKIGDQTWECQDLGGAIVKIGDFYWVDLLTTNSPYDYGDIVEGELL